MAKRELEQAQPETNQAQQKRIFLSSRPMKVTLFVFGAILFVLCVFVSLYAFGITLNWVARGAGDQAMGPLVIVLASIFPLPIGIGAAIAAAFLGSLLLASIFAKDKPPN